MGGIGVRAELGLHDRDAAVWRSSMIQGPPFRAFGPRALLVIAVAAIIGSGIGTVTYLTAVQQAGAALASTRATTAPLFATPQFAIISVGVSNPVDARRYGNHGSAPSDDTLARLHDSAATLYRTGYTLASGSGATTPRCTTEVYGGGLKGTPRTG